MFAATFMKFLKFLSTMGKKNKWARWADSFIVSMFVAYGLGILISLLIVGWSWLVPIMVYNFVQGFCCFVPGLLSGAKELTNGGLVMMGISAFILLLFPFFF
jgi:hypothetical protein